MSSFRIFQDRCGKQILSVRDQNTFDPALRRKRLMTLIHLFLIHRYKIDSVHYVSPTDDNHYQTQKMKAQSLFEEVHEEVGQIIVANVEATSTNSLLDPDRVALHKLIAESKRTR